MLRAPPSARPPRTTRASRRRKGWPAGWAAAGLALCVGALPVAADNDIWVELDRKDRPSVAIPSLAPLVESAGPACLVVFTRGNFRPPPGRLPPGHPAPPPGEAVGQGAGFLIHPEGYALTNYHVVENADEIWVKAGTGLTEIGAEVVGADKKTDVALLKLNSQRKDWPVIPLGDSDELSVGDFVVAIGNPFGLDQTVSLGILSAKGRREVAPQMRNGLYDFLQTDASINPGNSGGPLLNLHGEAVGINTAINAAAQGIGFAIPVNMVKGMLPGLKTEGRVVRSWMGIGIQRVTPELAEGLQLPAARGALVRQVVKGGPAEEAGLRPGDVITHFDGRLVRMANELPLIAAEAGVGRAVEVRLVREGRPDKLKIVLGEHPDTAPARAGAPRSPPVERTPARQADKRSLGLDIVTLNGADRERLDLPPGQEGARVVRVEPGSPAADSGLVEDDVITKADGEDIASARAFAQEVRETKSGDVIRVIILRDGGTQFVALVKP